MFDRRTACKEPFRTCSRRSITRGRNVCLVLTRKSVNFSTSINFSVECHYDEGCPHYVSSRHAFPDGRVRPRTTSMERDSCTTMRTSDSRSGENSESLISSRIGLILIHTSSNCFIRGWHFWNQMRNFVLFWHRFCSTGNTHLDDDWDGRQSH